MPSNWPVFAHSIHIISLGSIGWVVQELFRLRTISYAGWSVFPTRIHQISSWDRKCKLRTFFPYSARDQLEYQAQRLFSMELWGHFPRGIRASRNVQWAWLVLPAKQWHSTNATRHPNVTTKLESFCERKWEEARVRTKIDWILWTCSASCANYYLFRWEVSRFTFEIDHALNAPQGESGVQVNEVDFPLATDSCRAFEMTALSLSRVHPPPR